MTVKAYTACVQYSTTCFDYECITIGTVTIVLTAGSVLMHLTLDTREASFKCQIPILTQL
jgi:hypothetical protein